jgi:hypothetical protein
MINASFWEMQLIPRELFDMLCSYFPRSSSFMSTPHKPVVAGCGEDEDYSDDDNSGIFPIFGSAEIDAEERMKTDGDSELAQNSEWMSPYYTTE